MTIRRPLVKIETKFRFFVRCLVCPIHVRRTLSVFVNRQDLAGNSRQVSLMGKILIYTTDQWLDITAQTEKVNRT